MSKASRESNRPRIRLAAWTAQATGRVQGVGFRPAVARLARAWGLAGRVENTPQGARIHLQGVPASVRGFRAALPVSLPPTAALRSIQWRPARTIPGLKGFVIHASRTVGPLNADIPADMAVCPDCSREVRDPADRRFAYPFINCISCGPRYSIVTRPPYDRARTTMRGFRMCVLCRAEFTDPANRRYHAQPIACPACGPRAVLLNPDMTRVSSGSPALARARALIARGALLAVKGMGGYHLACDAASARAVAALRRRKDRPRKPFAVMVRDIGTARSLCRINAASAELLLSPRRPIVLLPHRTPRVRSFAHAAENAAPGAGCLGVMLPSTPLHEQLFEGPEMPRVMIMTSGNRRDEPLCADENEVRARLAGIADAVLAHDRPINNRCDDSIVQPGPEPGGSILIRRSRGFVPEPIEIDLPVDQPAIFAAGAGLKNSFCLTRGRQAYLSPYLGDLDSRESCALYAQTFERMRSFLGVRPRVIARDMHPDYFSTRFAKARRGRQIVIQHHEAHIASVLAEFRVKGPVIGFALDGTGYGTDGTIWGGECLFFDGRQFSRIACLDGPVLAGGDTAVSEVWRLGAAMLEAAGQGAHAARLWPRRPVRQVLAQVRAGYAAPRSSSAGRLFDAAAAIAGICEVSGYEAQAAMELEAAALDRPAKNGYNFTIYRSPEGLDRVSFLDAVRSMAADRFADVEPGLIGARFHETMARAVLALAERARTARGSDLVALSGGVMHNTILRRRVATLLDRAGFTVLINRRVPVNDGGIALGQAWLAARQANLSAQGD